MSSRRTWVSASVFALCVASACAASAARADQPLTLAEPPEQALTATSAADLSDAAIWAMIPPPDVPPFEAPLFVLGVPGLEPAARADDPAVPAATDTAETAAVEAAAEPAAQTAAARHPAIDWPAVDWPVVDWPVVDWPAVDAQAVETASVNPSPIMAAPIMAAPVTTASVDPAQRDTALAAPAAIDLAALIPEPPETPPLYLGDIVVVTPEQPRTDAPAASARVAETAPETDLAPLIAVGIAVAVRDSRLPDREEQAVLHFYAQRGHQPLWFSGAGLTEPGRRLMARLERAAEDGLRGPDYALTGGGMTPEELASADVRLSVMAVNFARDARGARLDPRRLSALITPKLELPATADVLGSLSVSREPGETLAGYLPRHEGYKALRGKLAALRAERGVQEPTVRIPAGPALRVGMRDARTALIRSRFGLGPSDEAVYNRELATRVAEFQREAGLPSTGVVNRATVEAMNGGRQASLEGDLIANMERWRWLPADLGDEHVFVNVPEYTVRKVEDGRVIHTSRAIVGRPERPTPIFSDMMDHLVLNPSWTIPPTILREDILPKLAADPGYAERRGLQVIRRGNNVIVRQPPGPSNALGAVKFMFPNDHAVYLHDTPNRSQFGLGRRAFSSGCVRVEQPMKLAEMILRGTQGNWSEQRLRGLVGSGERTIRLTAKVPVHLAYMTHAVGPDGQLVTFEDIYGFHRRTRDALGL
jgi:L,D-transpeptidase YcbB